MQVAFISFVKAPLVGANMAPLSNKAHIKFWWVSFYGRSWFGMILPTLQFFQLVWGLVPPSKVPWQLAFEPIPHEYPFSFGTSSLSHFARLELLPTLSVFPWVVSHLFSFSKGKRMGQTNYQNASIIGTCFSSTNCFLLDCLLIGRFFSPWVENLVFPPLCTFSDLILGEKFLLQQKL